MYSTGLSEYKVNVQVYQHTVLKLMYRFISISDSLPVSGNIKMVEIWMLFSLFLPFLEVVLQSYVNYLRRKNSPEDDSAILEVMHGLKKPHPQGTGFWSMAPDTRQVLRPYLTSCYDSGSQCCTYCKYDDIK